MGHTPGDGSRVEPSPRALGRWAQPASRRLASRSARTPGANRREADDRSGRPAAKARAEGLGEGDGDVAAHPGGHPRGQHIGRGDPVSETAPPVPHNTTRMRPRHPPRDLASPWQGRRTSTPRAGTAATGGASGHLHVMEHGSAVLRPPRQSRPKRRALSGVMSFGQRRSGLPTGQHTGSWERQARRDVRVEATASRQPPRGWLSESPGTGWSGSAGWAASRRTLGRREGRHAGAQAGARRAETRDRRSGKALSPRRKRWQHRGREARHPPRTGGCREKPSPTSVGRWARDGRRTRCSRKGSPGELRAGDDRSRSLTRRTLVRSKTLKSAGPAARDAACNGKKGTAPGDGRHG